MNRSISILSGVTIFLTGFCAVAQEPATADKPRQIVPHVFAELKAKAIPGWEKIERELGSVDVRFTSVFSEFVDGKLVATPRRPRYRIAWNHSERLQLLRAEYDDKPEAVFHGVANAGYSFDLLVRDPKVRGELLGIKLSESPQNDSDGNVLEPRGFSMHFRTACAACRFGTVPLHALINSPEFEPMEAIEEVHSGGRSVRYGARYLGSEGDSRKPGALYSMTLDPARSYRLTRSTITLPDRAGGHEREVLYHESPTVWVPRQVHSKQTTPEEHYVAEWLTEFELPQRCQIPEEEFRLEHYGFDESVLLPVSPNRWLRWLLMGLGIASLVMGYQLLARRGT